MIDQVIRQETAMSVDVSGYDDLHIGIAPQGERFSLHFCRAGTDLNLVLSRAQTWTLYVQLSIRLVTAPYVDHLGEEARAHVLALSEPIFERKKKRPVLDVATMWKKDAMTAAAR